MEEQLISFDTAKLAKEKGFNIPTISYYSPKGRSEESEGYMTERLECSNWNDGQGSYPTHAKDVECSAPTQSLLQKWLREVHNIEVLISRIPPEAVLADKNKGKNILKNYNCYIWNLNSNPRIANNSTFLDIYEEALEIGIFQALKLIK